MESRYSYLIAIGILFAFLMIFFSYLIKFLVWLKIIDLPDTIHLNIIKNDVSLDDFPE